MAIQVGSQVRSYRITTLIGAGGMGEVYRARDTKLNRDVAIKVLPAAFARDADGMDRFRREAQVLASLNHPNIASIYGLEEADGDLALALEMVEGEDLAQRLKRGQVPLEEALVIAKQIAQGLEAAHEKGVIHRDLKPANIKITKDGTTKILDFGLAKASEGDPLSSDSGVSQSPTVARHMTEAGIILGTAAYMSPEQARGKAVDKRTDIWAFGVVLFEMLTGQQLFGGETVTDMLAAVITREPGFQLLPSTTPAGVRRVLQRCLVRDPKKRLRDIGDVYSDLEDVSDELNIPAEVPRTHTLRRVLLLGLAATALVAATWTLSQRSGIDSPSKEAMHFDITYPSDIEPISGLQGVFAISPDGRSVAVIGVREGERRLFIRRLDRPEVVEISTTEGVNSVVFSPDSASVAFILADGVLTRLSLANQERVALVSKPDVTGNIAWGSSEIVYVSEGALWMVPATGGESRQLTVLDRARHEVLHDDPMVLPGGRSVLFSNLTTESGTERIESLSIDDNKRSVVIEHASMPIWSPTGHLLFDREGAVVAVPFDPKTATVRGKEITVIPAGVIGTLRSGSIGFHVSSTGTMVFVPFDFDYKHVIFVGRDGSESTLHLPPNRYGNPRLSPEGTRLLVETEGRAIETLDLVRNTRARLIAAALGTLFSTWTTDGQGVVFRRFNVPFWVAADGSGRAGPLPGGLINDFPSSPGPDPDSIIAVRIQKETAGDIFQISITGKFEPKPLIMTPAYDGGAQMSADRNWLLYQSSLSGQPEIYVRRYPALDRQWQVSEGGGVQPRWDSKNGEIYYRNGQKMMAVTFDGSGIEPIFGKPAALFDDVYDFGVGLSIPNYDVTHDGRFIMLRRGSHSSSLRVVLNWTEELKKILAAGGNR